MIMKLYIKRRDNSIDAALEYDSEKNSYTVLKGSKVSNSITMDKKFRSAGSIEKARSNGVVVNCIVTENVVFKSASTAANFVTGTSTNGKRAWKDENGKSLKEIQAEEI